MRRRLLIAPLIAAAVVVLAAVVPAARADIADMLDRKAPEPSCATWWNTKGPRIAGLEGQVVVLEFHDPGKITSKAFEGKVKALYERYADRPFHLIEVLVDCDEVDAQSYVARAGAKWDVGWDGNGDTAAAYMGSSVPRTYLIGPDGYVAWHAHIGALTDEIMEAQFRRASLYDDKALPRKAKTAARAARELRFRTAAAEAQKLLDDERSTEDEKQVARTILAEIPRYHEFQMQLVVALEKDLDWGAAWKRVERMREIYAGTEMEDEVEAEWQKLQDNARAVFIVAGEKELDRILEKTDLRKKHDLESALRELRNFVIRYENSKPGEKAATWVTELERRLEALEKRRR